MLGASLRSPGVRDQLNPQDGLYSVVVRDGDRRDVRIIGGSDRCWWPPRTRPSSSPP
ncbi:hypothetical protein [Brevundimonas denitrificans]|uniref:hypothetical protein n=1 Tax=Brevundimonas denitrificans TaxID=1443434 RepID=UPI00223B8501|nr:hypothetical protein [Brevundimonas denitrificans]